VRGLPYVDRESDQLAERRFEALVQSMVEKPSADGAVID
jgi:hypothetical protein